MMDLSSVVDASLALAGGVAVVMMGIGTLSSASTTVSTRSAGLGGEQTEHAEYPTLRKAA
jgi:hypothetical protein